jgi:hypothetical protein
VSTAPVLPTLPGQPGEPVVLRNGPNPNSLDPVNDPMGKLNKKDYDYEGMVDNLHSHLLGANGEQHRQGRHWYKIAQKMFHGLAKEHGISKARAVAIGAAFSPLTDWGDNVKYASQFLLNYRPEDPNHDEHDWQTAHIHPHALQAFRDQNGGRDPSASDDDLHQLADLHADKFSRGKNLDKVNDLFNPEARANWMENIQHKGMDDILADHEKQKFDNRLKKDDAGNIIGYNPHHAMRDSGIPTLGSNITKAKALVRAKEDPEEFYRILSGPKIRNFSMNILKHPRISRSGYYEHPNGDWTQHEDLGGTIDAHHLRAASMRHGEWVDSEYHGGAKGLDITNRATYDVFNRGLLEATRRYNAGIADPRKHITPRQAQAIIWKKHKDDNEFFGRQKVNGKAIVSESELPRRLRKVPIGFSKDPKGFFRTKAQAVASRVAALTPRELHDLPPLWREMFLTRQAPDWQDLVSSHMDHYGLHEPELGDDEVDHAQADRPDPLLSSVQAVLNYSAAVEKTSIPENIDEDWEGRVWNHIMRHPDGATFRDEPGDGPTDGYMVSLPGTEEKIPFYMLTPEDVGDFARANADDLNGPGNNMGTWSSPVPGSSSAAPHLYMDVSHNHDDSWEAAQAAQAGDQIGIYDLTHPDYNPEDRTRYVDTPQFVHDQIAKGGSRKRGQRN